MKFIKEWGIFILIIALIILSRVFVWGIASVSGPSMDPTLKNGQRLVMIDRSFTSIKRFDVVIAQESASQSSSHTAKDIVKRVIGMPGDTLKFEDDSLYIKAAGTTTFKEYKEPYLDNFEKLFATNKLADYYASLPLDNSEVTKDTRNYFETLAKNAKAFTTDTTGNPNFTVTVPEGDYFLMGDDRVVSADSRAVGPFQKNQILGVIAFRIWPLNTIGGV